MHKKVKGLVLAFVFLLSVGGYAPGASAQPFGIGSFLDEIRQEVNELNQGIRDRVRDSRLREIGPFARERAMRIREIAQRLRDQVASPSI